MAQPKALDLTGWRNTPLPPRILRFETGGVGIDLTGKTFALEVRAVPGEGSALISLDTALNDSADGVRVVEATAGRIRIQIAQPIMQAAWDAAYALGLMKAGEAAPLFYDLIMISPDGFKEAVIEGRFIIYPGVTL